jgi:hypothetical protein
MLYKEDMDSEILRRIFYRDRDHTEAEWLELVSQFRHIVQSEGGSAEPYCPQCGARRIPSRVVNPEKG